MKYDLMYCCKGNGTSVANRARMVHGDYQTIAHIADCGAIRWYVNAEKLPPDILRDVNAHALNNVRPFREAFIAQDKYRAMDRLCDILPPGEFLRVIHKDKLLNKGSKVIYDAYIKYTCRHGYTMPNP